MVMADQWYSSGTFWAAAGVVAVLLMGAIGIWVALWAANLTRRLDYGMTVAPLLNTTSGGVGSGVAVTWAGERLEKPHVLEVRLESHGRRDIAPEDFAGGPFQLDVGAPILTILQSASSGQGKPIEAKVNDEVRRLLDIGPALIGKHQVLEFTLLVDGDNPALVSPTTVLRDVDLKARSAEPTRRRRIVQQLIAIQVVTTLLVGVLVGVLFHTGGTSSHNRISPPTESLSAVTAKLGSGTLETRLSAIDTLQQIMQTTPAEQPNVVQALSSLFVVIRWPREHRTSP